MKKVIIIFLLFFISLFGEFKKNKDGFEIITNSLYNDDVIFTLNVFSGKKKEKPHAILSFNVKFDSIAFDGYLIVFKDNMLDFAQVGNYTYPNKNTTNIIIKNEAGLYSILIEDKRILKYFFKSIIENEKTFTLFTDNDICFFSCFEYKNNIINSKFYKKIIE